MRSKIAMLSALLILALPAPAAAQAEVRTVALNANCKPKKIDLLRQTRGSLAENLYEVTCESKGEDIRIKVLCRGKLCKPTK